MFFSEFPIEIHEQHNVRPFCESVLSLFMLGPVYKKTKQCKLLLWSLEKAQYNVVHYIIVIDFPL